MGPVLARLLDRAADGRRVLAGAFALYGVVLAAGSAAVGHVPVAVAMAPVIVAGLCGPLLTGGLSSRLAGLAGPDEVAQRRAQGLDAVSYGIGGSAGPAAVAALAAAADPLVAMLALSFAAILAAAIVLALPSGRTPRTPAEHVLPVRRALREIATSGPLRRVAYVTMITTVPGGAIAVVAVALGRQVGASTVSGAVLTAAFGLGNFLASLSLTAFPLKGEPDRLVGRCAVVVAVAFGLCAIAPGLPVAVLAFGLAGAANAPLFTATLAVRSVYAPTGARAQVFVSMAGLKVAAAAVGVGLAGAFIAYGPRLLLVAGAVLILAAAAAAAADRRFAPAPAEPDAAPRADAVR